METVERDDRAAPHEAGQAETGRDLAVDVQQVVAARPAQDVRDATRQLHG